MNWKELPPDSKVWIYQAERFLTLSQTEYIKSASHDFLTSWSSHGNALQACIELFHNLFVVIFVDESKVKASGCSIDKSVQLIKAIENYTGISFTNRQKTAFFLNEEIFITDMNKLNRLYKEGIIKDDTLFFDNLVHDKNSFSKAFLKPLSAGWQSRFIEAKSLIV
jgi:hypothetical protein